MAKANGAILYSGPSMIDGKPIVVIVTGLAKATSNGKTGDMVQTWILRSDIHPVEALATGGDSSICGGCPHRPKTHDGSKFSERSCYVNVMGPNAVFKAYKAGKYATMPTSEIAKAVAGRMVRLGSYGDPAAAPLAMWRVLVSQAAGHTGYTHQWKSERLRGVTELCQASADTAAELDKARSLGLGTFRVRSAAEPVQAGEIVCPASEEAGKVTTCADCRMCDGSSARNVVIIAHGTGAGYVAKRKALPTLQVA